MTSRPNPEAQAALDAVRAALIAFDDAAKDVQEHWSDPGAYTHNRLLTPQLIHEKTIAEARAALDKARLNPEAQAALDAVTAADVVDAAFCCPLVGLYPCEQGLRGCYCHERHLLDARLKALEGKP